MNNIYLFLILLSLTSCRTYTAIPSDFSNEKTSNKLKPVEFRINDSTFLNDFEKKVFYFEV